MEVRRTDDMILLVIFILDNDMLNVINVYALQVGFDKFNKHLTLEGS